jgi:uncharacterized membrane protein
MSTNEPPPEQPVPPPGGYGEAPPPPPPPPTGGYGGTTPPPPPAPAGGASGYSVGNAFSYGWTKFTQNIGQILVAVLVLVGVLIVIQAVGFFIGRAVACEPEVSFTNNGAVDVDDCSGIFVLQNIVSWVFSLISWVISMIIGAGIVRAALDITEGKDLDPKTILTPRRLGEVVVASLLIGIATFVGFILLVIPGRLVMFFTSYTLYFLMDKEELGAIDAIKASFEFTKTNAGNVLLWFLVSVVAWVIGACLCGIGLVVAVPVVLIGTAYTYKTLNNEPVAA